MTGTGGMMPQGSGGSTSPADGIRRFGAAAATRALTGAISGLVAGVLASVPSTWQIGVLVGWDTAAAVYVVWTWATLRRCDPAATARLAVREDPGRATVDAVLLVASVASVLAVVIVITAGSARGALTRDALAALAVASGLLSWTVVQVVYALHYARLYYSDPVGGIDFNDGAPPRYSDFAYVAFTVGMTYQVSDTNLKTSAFRAAALPHAMLSYLFGAVILATTINLMVGLVR
jgi:uncharacterized membrane protein